MMGDCHLFLVQDFFGKRGFIFWFCAQAFFGSAGFAVVFLHDIMGVKSLCNRLYAFRSINCVVNFNPVC